MATAAAITTRPMSIPKGSIEGYGVPGSAMLLSGHGRYSRSRDIPLRRFTLASFFRDLPE